MVRSIAVGVGILLSTPSCANDKSDSSASPNDSPSSVVDVRAPRASESERQLAEIGTVLGAVADEKAHRLYIIGDGKRADCALDSSVIASSLLSAEGEVPYLSIDPIEGDLEGPWMNVRVSPGVADSKLGWTMFEADRLLKSYSLGADTVTRFPLLSGVDGFVNSFGLALELGGQDEGEEPVWSRFWFRPKRARASMTDKAITVVEASMMVDTEVMVARNGKLEPSPDAVDEGAERFAGFFSKNYKAFGKEAPIFAELEQAMRLMVIGQWVKKEGIALDRGWLARQANVPFAMPRVTPSLSGTMTRTEQDSDGVTELTISLYGGVSFDGLSVDAAQSDVDFSGDATALAAAAKASDSPAFPVELGGEKYVGFWLPMAGNDSGTDVARALELPLGEDGALDLYARRDPESGDLDELVLPSLQSSILMEGESYGVVSLGDVEVPVRAYELFGARGEYIGRFEEHEVDQERQELLVMPVDMDVEWRLYIPASDTVVAEGPDGTTLVFSAADGKLRQQLMGDTTLEYAYADGGALANITASTGGETERLAHFTSGSNGTRILSGTRDQDGDKVVFAEAAAGSEALTLKATNEGGETFPVKLEPKTANWSSDKETVGLEYLTERGPEILERLTEAPERPSLIPSGSFTLLVEKKSIRPIAFPLWAYVQLMDAVAQLGVPGILGVVPAGDGRMAVLTEHEGEMHLEVFRGDRRLETMEGLDARIGFQTFEAALARSLSTKELQLISLVEAEDGTAAVAMCRDREVDWDAQMLDSLEDASAETDVLEPVAAVDEVMADEAAYILTQSATSRTSAAPALDYSGLPHQVSAVSRRQVSEDHKFVRATINFHWLSGSVTSVQFDVVPILSSTNHEALTKAFASAAEHGLAVVDSPSAASRHILVTDASDDELRAYFKDHGGQYIDTGIVLLRIGHAPNDELYTELMRQCGLRYVVDHEVALDVDSAGLLVSAMGEALEEAGEGGLGDASLFRAAVDRVLKSTELTDEQRGWWYLRGRRSLLKLSDRRPFGGDAEPPAPLLRGEEQDPFQQSRSVAA
jgi:hypothetical protein